MDEEQNATLYLTPNQKPSFETVTVRQISALILELEATDYVFSFESKVDNFYLDHFVLLPSDYFESTVLADNIDHACKDLRDKETCVQYKYASIERFGPQKLDGTIDLDKLKEFNHTYEKPLMVTLLEPRGGLTKTLQFPPQKSPGDVSNSRTSGPEYVLLVDFVNTNLNGKELQVDITNADSDSNKKQSGRVFLYNCNLTTLCREVLLSKDFNEPLVIKGKNSADFKLSLQPSAGDNGQVMLYQVTLMPKEKFNVNHIKMAPYCIVKNKQCLPLEYPHFQAHKIDLETFDNNGRQDLFRPSQSGSVGGESQTYEYIPKNKIIYLNNYFVSTDFNVLVAAVKIICFRFLQDENNVY
jgi:laminin alpha 3/5